MREHTSDSFFNCSVHPLCNSVQLRCLWNCFLKLDALTLAVAFKWASVLTTIISSHDLELSTSFSLNSSLKLLESRKYPILGFQHSNPHFSRIIINKRNKVKSTTMGFSIHRTYISVDKIKRILSSRWGARMKSNPMLFTS